MTQCSSLPLAQPEPFRFSFAHPYQSFIDGKPAPIPYIVDGLLTQGGLSILGGKPKQGKSSMSRYLAVCVAAGKQFLGRDARKGEVILLNLEDPTNHTDNCLKALGYDPAAGHGQIHIVTTLSPKIDETFDALINALERLPDVRLVIVDHLAKLLRLKDLSEYMPVQAGCQRLRDVARKFPHVHIMALAHCKKVQTDDPFDQILGSTAMRGEPDTNLVIFGQNREQNRERFIISETRVGRAIQATQLLAELVTLAGANVISNLTLGMSLHEWEAEKGEKVQTRNGADFEHRIISFLQGCDGKAALQQSILRDVTGKTERKIDAINNLTTAGILISEGSPRKLTLTDGDELQLYTLGKGK
jgi:AAA domain